MGMSKNLMLAYFPEDDGEEDDFDDFFRSAQADEPKIHQPGLVKSHNLEIF